MSTPRHNFSKRTVQKDDGRLLLFYTFDCTESCSSSGDENAEGKTIPAKNEETQVKGQSEDV
jgi:hypothetical protein